MNTVFYGSPEYYDLLDNWEDFIADDYPVAGDLSSYMYANYQAGLPSGNALGQSLPSDSFDELEADFLTPSSILSTAQNATDAVLGLSAGAIGSAAFSLNAANAANTNNIMRVVLENRGLTPTQIATYSEELAGASNALAKAAVPAALTFGAGIAMYDISQGKYGDATKASAVTVAGAIAGHIVSSQLGLEGALYTRIALGVLSSTLPEAALLIASPLSIGILSVAASYMAAQAVINHWDDIVSMAQAGYSIADSTWNGIVEGMNDTIEDISSGIDTIESEIQELWESFIGSIPQNTTPDEGAYGPHLPASGSGPADQASPLVFDLSGDGVDLYAAGDYGTYFDLRGNGQAVLTGWAGPADGLLAVDANDNGSIDDISELFGTLNTDGFAVLAAYDSNHDGAITSADADFGDLLMWVDANSDGVSQGNELYSLTDLEITSISLNATRVNDAVAGNRITHESTFTMDGNVRTVVDAWFGYDAGNTRNAADFAFDLRSAFLPTLRGYGDLKDLYIAASIDNGASPGTAMERRLIAFGADRGLLSSLQH